MNVQDYIKVYENVVSNNLCNAIMKSKFDYKSSSFSSHTETYEDSTNRVIMDDFWIRKDNNFYNPLKECYVKAVRQYEYDFPRFECV